MFLNNSAFLVCFKNYFYLTTPIIGIVKYLWHTKIKLTQLLTVVKIRNYWITT